MKRGSTVAGVGESKAERKKVKQEPSRKASTTKVATRAAVGKKKVGPSTGKAKIVATVSRKKVGRPPKSQSVQRKAPVKSAKSGKEQSTKVVSKFKSATNSKVKKITRSTATAKAKNSRTAKSKATPQNKKSSTGKSKNKSPKQKSTPQSAAAELRKKKRAIAAKKAAAAERKRLKELKAKRLKALTAKNLREAAWAAMTPEERKAAERKKRNWEGNSDDEGSVDSGALEENICYECGVSTACLCTPEELATMILCDRCEGEYHITCVGFEAGDLVPRHSWVCPKCKEEEKMFKGLQFKIPHCSLFTIPRPKKVPVQSTTANSSSTNSSKGQQNESTSATAAAQDDGNSRKRSRTGAGDATDAYKKHYIFRSSSSATSSSSGRSSRSSTAAASSTSISSSSSTGSFISVLAATSGRTAAKSIIPPVEICYSPASPIGSAWQECQQKGFMMVSRVFSYEVMKALTHGCIEKRTSSGRVAEKWDGVCEEIGRRVAAGGHNLVNRGGRFDVTLPEFVVEELRLEALLKPITDLLHSIMGQHPPPALRTHNIVFAPVGSRAQAWHCDDSLHKPVKHRYFTILIHLNTIDSECGGTEVWSKEMQRGDLIRGRPGDAFVFNGSLLHRGQANNGRSHRFFYYASYACKSDVNSEHIEK